MQKSLWQKDNNLKNMESIDKNITTDILIVGAGITGVSIAYNLINSKNKVVLIEQGTCCNGVTSKSTGKLTYLQDLVYSKINKMYGFDFARLYYESQKDAIKMVKKIVKDNNIDCDLKKCEAITFTSDKNEIKKFQDEKNILDKFGVNYSSSSKNIDGTKIKEIISVKNTYVFNPVKYVKSLIKLIKNSNNIIIYENSMAKAVRKEEDYFITKVNNFEIKSKKIVFACNYPFFILPGLIPLKTYLEKSYITATKVDKTFDISGINSNYPTISFRFHEEKDSKYFIYLSNSSKICDKLNYNKNYDTCIKEAKKIIGKSPYYKWTNMDVMTNDHIPLIGRVSNDEANAFIATGYNTWGMTNGVIAGKVIYDLLTNKKNKYINLFDPSRDINFKKILNFMSNTLFSNIKAYGLNLIKKNPSWYKEKAMVTKLNGKRVGIYYDKDGNSHVVSNICPHFKCFLTFNETDKTWDCPCHGSRFDIDGNVVKGPSVNDIKIDETKF